MPPWARFLRDFFLGMRTEDALRAAIAPHADLGKAVLGSMEISSTFSAPVGPPDGMDESRDLGCCHPELQRRFAALRADFEKECKRQLIITSTYRSPRRQAELYAQGRTAPGKVVTRLDGIHKKSRHNVWPAEAVDVAVDVDPGPGKHISWDHAAYLPLGPLAARHGLIWGGGWKSIPDDPHLELPAGAV